MFFWGEEVSCFSGGGGEFRDFSGGGGNFLFFWGGGNFNFLGGKITSLQITLHCNVPFFIFSGGGEF